MPFSFADEWALARVIDLLQHAGAEPRLIVGLAASEETRRAVESELRGTSRIETLHQPSTPDEPVPPAIGAHRGSHYNNLLFVVDGVEDALAAGGDRYLAALDRGTPTMTRIGTWVWLWTSDPATYRRMAAGAPELWAHRAAAPVFFEEALLVPAAREAGAGAAAADGAAATPLAREVAAALERDDVAAAAAQLDDALGDRGERGVARPAEEQALLWALRGTARLRGGELVAARDAFRRLRDLAAGVPVLGHDRAQGTQAEVLLAAGEPRRALEVLAPADHRTLAQAAELAFVLGEPHGAVARLCESVRAAGAAGVPAASATALVRLAELLVRLGAPARAAGVAERAAGLAAGPAAPWTRVEALRVAHLGWRRAGETGRADSRLGDARAAVAEARVPALRMRALAALAAAELDAERGEDATRRATDALRAAVSAADEGGQLHQRVEARVALSGALRGARGIAEAAPLAAEAAKLAAGGRRFWLAARAELERALVARARVEEAAERGDDAALDAALADTIEALEEAGRDAAAETAFVELLRARLLRADAAFWEGRTDGAVQLLDSAVDLAGARGLALGRCEALELRLVALAETAKASRALGDLAELERLAAEIGLPELMIRAELRRGDHYARLALGADAEARWMRAAEIARALADRDAAAEAVARRAGPA